MMSLKWLQRVTLIRIRQSNALCFCAAFSGALEL
jgi:hypothetical protein